MRGKTANRIKKIHRRIPEQKVKEVLLRFLDPGEYQFSLFGSRASGKARLFSDYDIGILGRRQVSLETLAMIKEALEESDLPYTIDVVDLSAVSQEFKRTALLRAKRI